MKKIVSQGFFISGTGTDVGKTFVCRILAQSFLKKYAVSYMKPIQTGCVRTHNEHLESPDFEYVKRCGGLRLGSYEMHVPYRFVPACSPHLAAQITKTPISLRKIQANFNKIKSLLQNEKGIILVEGAGGVLVPINKSINSMHLMASINLPVILVTTPALGTLNHTFLSVCALQSCGLRIAGVVFNSINKKYEKFIYDDNRKMISSALKGVPFLELKFNYVNTTNVMEFCDEVAKRYI